MEVDALFLSDAAQIRSNLLYTLGGGWMRTWPPSGQRYPFSRPLAISAILRVGWNETNEDHSFEIQVRDSDEVILGEPVQGNFNVGRDANLTQGMSQILAFSGVYPVTLPATGIYSVMLTIDGTEEKRIEFEALARPPQTR
jgi:hypothetical protein